MDFKQLEAFAYVVKLKSFSRAAEQIYLTQPTISNHISTLEKELDTKLLERGSKTVYPTPSGKILYQDAEKMLNLREAAVCAVRRYNKELKGNLTICASTVPSQYVLPNLMTAFREEYPNVVFQINRQDSGQVVETIVHRNAVLGFTGTTSEDRDIAFESFTSDRMVIITPNTEKFRKMDPHSFDLNLLRSEPIVLREEGSGTRKEMEHFLSQVNLDIGELNVVAQFDDPDSIKHAVSKGLGISIISRAAVEDYVSFGQLLTFELKNVIMERNLYMVYRKGGTMPFIGEVFMNFVRSYFDKKEEE